MKKVIAIALAVLICVGAISITAMAKRDELRFEFNDNYQHGQGDHRETPTNPPAIGTDTDCPDTGLGQDGHNRPVRPQTPTEPDTDTDEADRLNSIFDAVAQLKHHGLFGKHFRIPMNDACVKLMDMVIEDGKVFFGYQMREDADGETKQLAMDGEEAPEGMSFITLGDNDADGAVTARDALAVLKHVVNKAPMEHEGRRILSDMDQDEEVTAADALCVLKTVVGKN